MRHIDYIYEELKNWSRNNDSGISHSSFYIKTITTKVLHPYKRKDIVIGCAGSIRMSNLLQANDTMFECLPENKYINDNKLIVNIIQKIIPKIESHSALLKECNEEFDLILAIKIDFIESSQTALFMKWKKLI